ncbi:hypothetical protein MY11210_004104 [Beauveria gryllotalpidicola]
MPLTEPQRPATLPAASIPDHDTATELQSTYNSPSCSSPRPRSLSLLVEQTATTTAAASSPALDDIPDNMLSIHPTKSEPFASAGLGAPALPEKSALRASRLLATLPQKLPEDRTVLTHAAPHLVYLSSEEDGSSSADDLSDLDSFESDSEESLDGCVTHGEFARVVSVIFSGKPSVINLTGRSTSLTSLRRRPSDDAALRPTSTVPSLARIRSSSSCTSSATSSLNHPPRSSSIITSIDKRRPKFLHVDPFAVGKSDRDDTDSLKTPKTPTAMFSRAFSSLVKKRSRATLSTAPRDNELVHMEQVGEEATEDLVEDESISPKSAGPTKYHDIMTAKKNAQQVAPAPTAPTSPNSAKNGLRSFSLSRRMSIRV